MSTVLQLLPGDTLHSNDLLTPNELAERLKVPLSWVYEKTRRRSQDPLPVIRIGKYVRFCWPDVVAWLARHEVNGLDKHASFGAKQ